MRDYVPDDVVRRSTEPPLFLIVETKRCDPLDVIKRAAAVNTDGRHGRWTQAIASKPEEVGHLI